MKFNTIYSLVFGIYCLSGLCSQEVYAGASVQLYPSANRQINPLAARAEHDNGDATSVSSVVEAAFSEPTASRSGEPWTDDEVDRLLQLRGEERRSWTDVAQSFPERSGFAVLKKYYKLTRNPTRTQAKPKPWTDDEEETLLELAGTDATWEERAVYLPGRSATAARSHYHYLISDKSLPKEYKRLYTAEEDELLRELDEAGIPWKERVTRFDNRTIPALHYRMKKLKEEEKEKEKGGGEEEGEEGEEGEETQRSEELEGPKTQQAGKFTLKEDDDLIKALDLGMTLEEITELLGRSRRGVQRRIKALEQANRIADRTPQISKGRWHADAEYELMRESLEQGMSWKDIAAEHFPGRAANTIKKAYYREQARKESEGEKE